MREFGHFTQRFGTIFCEHSQNSAKFMPDIGISEQRHGQWCSILNLFKTRKYSRIPAAFLSRHVTELFFE